MTAMQKIQFVANKLAGRVCMKSRQEPLRRSYVTDPEKAWILDRAETSSSGVSCSDPIHGEVFIGTEDPKALRTGVHRAVGGNCDMPNPGEILTAALSACLDSTIRIIANRFGLPIKHLSVRVDALVDVRGTLHVDKSVPVGFQSIEVFVDLQPAVNIPREQVARLIEAAERSCVVLQTLRSPPEIRLSQT